jgi:fluoride exporter
MNPPELTTLVAVCGGVGAVARFALDAAVQRRVRRATPFGTISVNIIGSFVLGVITGLVIHHHLSVEVERVIGIGLCGGLTTFSTASFETVRLLRERLPLAAFTAAIGGLTLSCAAGAVGLVLALA